jgi:chromate transporter
VLKGYSNLNKNTKILKGDIMKHLQLFLAFFRVGILGYGGGPSSIPLVHKEVVDKYRWMNDDEFADVLALGNTLPGPIATKMAGYIGYRVAGIWGLINATLSTIVPTIILMIVLLTTISSVKDYPWVQGMTAAVVPVVGVMLATLTWDFFKKSQKSLGWLKSFILIVISFLLMEILGLHPAILISGLLLAAILKRDKDPKTERKIERGNAS